MTGIFDSGVGGMVALRELRRLVPSADICYYADRKNAPYGTKDRQTIRSLVMRDIDILSDAGADQILIACCTACTVYDELPEKYREIATPIIGAAARRAAQLTERGRIAVICTYATARSHAFENEIRKINTSLTVTVHPSSELVRIVEEGARDGAVDSEARRIIESELFELRRSHSDVVILGCTHFSHIRKEIENILSVRSVSAAHEGARIMADKIKTAEEGRTKYLSRK